MSKLIKMRLRNAGICLFIMISRKKPLMQKLGIFFDVLIGVLIMGILIFRINKTFDSIDTDMLKNLIG